MRLQMWQCVCEMLVFFNILLFCTLSWFSGVFLLQLNACHVGVSVTVLSYQVVLCELLLCFVHWKVFGSVWKSHSNNVT